MTKSSLAQAINTFYEYLTLLGTLKCVPKRPSHAELRIGAHPAKLPHSLLPLNSRIISTRIITAITAINTKKHNRYEYSTTNPNTLSITYKFSHISIAASDPRRLETKQASTIQAPKPCRTTLISAAPSSEVLVAKTTSEAGALNSVTRQRAICVSFLFLS